MMRFKVMVVVTLVLATVAIGTAFAQNERQGGQVFGTDPNPASSDPAGGVGTEIVADGGFEAGSPNPNWTEASSNFGTPLCTTGLCGTGGGTGPASGLWWAWFGGIAAPETGSVSQTVMGGANDACTLSFSLEIPVASGNGTDFLDVSIGGTTVYSALENTPGFATYAPVVVDVSGFINGTAQTLSFDSSISGTPGLTNFFVDDVSLTCQAGVPTTPRWGLLLLAVLLTVGALTVWRRQVAAR